jgi:hypothetical protein
MINRVQDNYNASSFKTLMAGWKISGYEKVFIKAMSIMKTQLSGWDKYTYSNLYLRKPRPTLSTSADGVSIS